MIPLAKDTISKDDINKLIEWLKTNPRLTKSQNTIQFEEEWSEWLWTKYSVYVNSGSSANLAAVYALILSERMKNKKIIIPAVSWSTTIAPTIQFGLKPILVDCNPDNLGVDLEHLKRLFKKHNPSALMLVHVLGMPNEMDRVEHLCKKYDVMIIEDSCESIGSLYKGRKTGTFGLMSTFSFFYGHGISTIEGGMISTDDKELYDILLSIRSHGWDRDLDVETQKKMREENNIDNFNALYRFYYPGFNIRSTDLQAFIGLQQMKKLDKFCEKRGEIFHLYSSLIENKCWKPEINSWTFTSALAYPIISFKRNRLVRELQKNNVEVRPLIAGNLAKHPFAKKYLKKRKMKSSGFCNIVDDHGLYLPVNYDITKKEVRFVCDIVNTVLK